MWPRRYLIFCLLVAPAFLLRLLTAAYPIGQTIALSFTDLSLLRGTSSFVGLQNYQDMFSDYGVRGALGFTINYVLWTAMLDLVVGMLVALLLNTTFRGRTLVRTLTLIPWAVPTIVAGYTFRWLLDDQFGLIPHWMLQLTGIRPVVFTSPTAARITVVLVQVWKDAPFIAIVLLAGLQGVPQDIYEAARVDGASAWQRFWRITLPLVTPLLFSLSTTLLTLLVSFLAAYAFARIAFPGSGLLLWILVLSMALPDVGTIVPLYRILSGLRLLDTIAGLTLVLSSALTPFTVWVLVSFIRQVPYEIEEAAIIDGASLPQIFLRVLLPVTLPGLVTMGLINFVNAWNNLLYPLSFSVSPHAKTLSVAITEVFAGYSPWGKPWELIMAVGVTMVVPIVLMVLVSQRAIVSGLTRGALK